jgi:protein AroM
MTRALALLTIGRSPRPDIRSDMERLLSGPVEIVERGALDRISDDEAHRIRPADDDDALIASLGASGEAIVSKAEIGRLLMREIAELEERVDGFAILCTGVFPALESRRTIAQAGELLLSAGAKCNPGLPIGVLVPIAEQRTLNERLFAAGGRPVATAVASPYEGTEPVVTAALTLRDQGMSAIAMSCMGYSEAMRRAVEAETALPAIGPSQVLSGFFNREWNE